LLRPCRDLPRSKNAKVERLQSFTGYPQQEGLAERMPTAQSACILLSCAQCGECFLPTAIQIAARLLAHPLNSATRRLLAGRA
jgi:hypothetical protein